MPLSQAGSISKESERALPPAEVLACSVDNPEAGGAPTALTCVSSCVMLAAAPALPSVPRKLSAKSVCQEESNTADNQDLDVLQMEACQPSKAARAIVRGVR